MVMIRSKHFHRSLLCLAACGLLLTLGCGKNPVGPTNLVVFETIYKGATAYPISSAGPFQGAIRDDANWQTFWTGYFTTATPPVDFSQQMVLAVILPINACDNGVEIQTVEDVGGRWIVQAVHWVAPLGTVCTTDIVPMRCHVIKVARSALPVEFVVTQKARS
jgi:hypothetical protein